MTVPQYENYARVTQEASYHHNSTNKVLSCAELSALYDDTKYTQINNLIHRVRVIKSILAHLIT